MALVEKQPAGADSFPCPLCPEALPGHADSTSSFEDVELSSQIEESQAPLLARVSSGEITDGSQDDGDGDAVDSMADTRTTPIPFRRWMKSLRRKARQRSDVDHNNFPPCLEVYHEELHQLRVHHRKLSSGSSSGFVAAVKSASVSLVSASIGTRPGRTDRRSRGQSRTERSSRASFSGISAVRASEDSAYGDRVVIMDPAAANRALQRRRILEELISTEESYIGDVRFLTNIYVTVLAAVPTLPAGLRASMNQNLAAIVELHEEILGDLHRVVPDSEYSQRDAPLAAPAVLARGHRRWRSLDAVPEDQGASRWPRVVPGLACDAQIAGDVAKIFSRKMDRFFIYEEYGAKYEMLVKDVASTYRQIPEWESYQKGLETLASSLNSIYSASGRQKKALTIGDLLVKPVQRMCKYPLLFSELLKHTPINDDPNSHMEVESALLRLREATAEINKATSDRHMASTLQRTWILQDRLVFPKQRLDASSRNRIRSFGHVQLCGALHICWQGRSGVKGQYMVCLLYSDLLCLATAGRVEQVYTVEACINLDHTKLEEADNGKGLQCHTAPYSWKLTFECDSQLYEIIMTACCQKEQKEWRCRLHRPAQEAEEQTDPALLGAISLDIQSLGTVFGKPGTVARRISIHRATTIGSKSPLCQVVLRNTAMAKDTSSEANPHIMNRSQSLLSTNQRVPVLAPARGERARLEALLSDVWSRETLPFPSMTGKARGEHIVRSSASTMMRRLSVTSIAGSLSKRTNSVASLSKFLGEDKEGEETPQNGKSNRSRRKQRRNSRCTVADQELLGPFEQAVEPAAVVELSAIKDESSSVLTPLDEPGDAAATQTTHEHHNQGSKDHTLALDLGPLRVSSSKSLTSEPGPAAVSDEQLTSHAQFLVATMAKSKHEPMTKKPKLGHRGVGRWRSVGRFNRDDMMLGIKSFFSPRHGHVASQVDARGA